MRKVIKIFLASSITEFEAERNDLEVFIRNMSDIYEDQYDIKIKPVRCEQIDPYITDSRTQDIINESLRECEMCVILVYTRFGQFSYEEFRYALQSFRESAEHLPKIYVYFKCLEEGVTVDDSVKAFMDELNNSLKHYYGTFKSLDTVKLRIALNFVAQKLDISSVTMDEGKLMLNGVRMDGLDVQNVSEFSNSEQLQELYAQLRKIEPRYYELHAKYKKGEFSTASPLFEEYSKLATERSGLKTEIEDLENAIFDFSIRLSKDEVNGNISERQKAAYRLFEAGDLEGANEVLDEEEIESDYRARKAKILARKMEELRKNAVIYIHEMKTKIDILKILPANLEGQKTIERLYEKILPEAEEMGVCLDVFYDYATYLFEHLGWEDREGRLRKALDLALQLADLYAENEKESSFEKEGELASLTGKLYLAMAGGNSESSYLKQALQCLKSAEEAFSVLAMRHPDKYNGVLTEVFQHIGKIYELKKEFVEAEKYYVKPVRFFLQSGKLRNVKHKKALADNYVKMNTAVCFDKAIALYQELCEVDEVLYLDGLRNCYKKYAELCKEALGITRGLDIEMENRVLECAEKALAIAKQQVPADPKKYNRIIAEYYGWLAEYYVGSLEEAESKAYFLTAVEHLEKCITLSDAQESLQNEDFDNIIKYYERLSSCTRYNLSNHTDIAIVEDENERAAYGKKAVEWKKRSLYARAQTQKSYIDVKDHTFSNMCYDFAKKSLSAEEIPSFIEDMVFSNWREHAKTNRECAMRLLQEYFYTGNLFSGLAFAAECLENCEKLAKEIDTEESRKVLTKAYLNRGGYYLGAGEAEKAEEYLNKSIEWNAEDGEAIAKMANDLYVFYNLKYNGDTAKKESAQVHWLLVELKYTQKASRKAHALEMLGGHYKGKCEYEKAIEYYKACLAYKDENQKSNLYYALQICYQALGNTQEAERYGALYLSEQIAVAKKDVAGGFKPYLGGWEDACEKIAKTHVEQGDWAKAKEVIDSISVYLEEVIASGKTDFTGEQGEFEEALRNANFHRLDAYLVYGKYEDGIELARRLVARTTEKLTALEQSKSYHANADKIMFTYGLYKWQYYLFKCYAALQDSRLEAQLLAFLDAAKKTEHREAYWAMCEVREYLEKNGYPSPLSEAKMLVHSLGECKEDSAYGDELLARLEKLIKEHELDLDILGGCAYAMQRYGLRCNDNEKAEQVCLRAATLFQKIANAGDMDALNALKRLYENIGSLFVSSDRDKWFDYQYLKIIEFLESIECTEETDDMLRLAYDEVFERYYYRGKYEMAVQCCVKMEAILKKRPLGDLQLRQLALLYNNWSVVYQAMEQHDAQREKLLLAEEMLKAQFGKDGELKAKGTLATVYNNLASLAKAEGDYAQAKTWYLQSFACQADTECRGRLKDRLEERIEFYEKVLPFFEEYAKDTLEEVVLGYADVCKRAYAIRNEALKHVGYIPEEYLKSMQKMLEALVKAEKFALARTINEEQLSVARELLQKAGLKEISYLKDALRFAVDVYAGLGETEKAEQFQKELLEMSV